MDSDKFNSHKGGPKNTSAGTQFRRLFVLRLSLQGFSLSDIQARVLKEIGQDVSDRTISEDIAKARPLLVELAREDISNALQMEVERLNAVETEAWRAWRASQYPNKVGKATKPGNYKFLDQITKVVALRSELTGLTTNRAVLDIPVEFTLNLNSHNESKH